MNNLISIIMPTFNDSDTIIKTLDSVLSQTYSNWELIIVNDGSTDKTEQIIKEYIINNNSEEKIIYIYQDNSDQLNAIKKGLNYISGYYVYILHSDDLLPSNDFLEKCVMIMTNNHDCDALIGDYTIIDKDDYVTDYTKTPKYRNKRKNLGQVMLKYGGNIYGDVAFHRRSSYENNVKYNYLDWNTPFWINFKDNEIKMLNVINANFSILKYRLDGTNYNTNMVGKHNVLTGELRTMTNIMKNYNIPLFTIQQFNYNLFRKRYIRELRLSQYVPLIMFKGEQKNKAKILDRAIRRIYPNGYEENEWLDSLVKFYSKKSTRVITISGITDKDVMMGSDLRKFTNLLFEKKLPDIYYRLFNEMKEGFKTIVVKSKKDAEFIEKISRFICIYPEINIDIRKK